MKKLRMVVTAKMAPSLGMVIATARHSTLFFVLIGLAAASLVLSFGLLVGAVLIH